ncbi:protein of unknown function (plasmid) [Caballeronia sp. S22]
MLANTAAYATITGAPPAAPRSIKLSSWHRLHLLIDVNRVAGSEVSLVAGRTNINA